MKYTVNDLRADFPTEEACLEWLINYQFPDGVTCKKCAVITKHYPIKGRRSYTCGVCGHQIYPTARTIFHKSRTPLTSWFYAMYLMSTNKAGTSAKQVERELGVTYKTAWRMMHQIRLLMGNNNLLRGEVEIDETYIHANTFKRSSARKRYGWDARRTGEVVVGMVERGGSLKVFHIDSASSRNVLPLIHQNIKYGSVVHTDGWIPYRILPKLGYEHRWTDHGKGEYYRKDSYTQNIENFWSHLKRGIKGIYRHVTSKYLQRYANEFAWRYSHRNAISMFWALMGELSPLSSTGRRTSYG